MGKFPLMTRESKADRVEYDPSWPWLDPAAPVGGAPQHTKVSTPEVYPRHRRQATCRPRASRPGHDRRPVLASWLSAWVWSTTNIAPRNPSAGNLGSICRMNSELRDPVARCSVFMPRRSHRRCERCTATRSAHVVYTLLAGRWRCLQAKLRSAVVAVLTPFHGLSR